MKNILISSFSFLLLFLFPANIFAQGTQQRDRVQDPTSSAVTIPAEQQNQVQNQNQVSTQNMGENYQLQVTTQHMEQLMSMEGSDEEVGSKVRTLAQQQIQAQTQIQTQLNQLEAKSAFMKKLFGPDFGAIKNLKQQVEQNRLRIQALQELQNQVVNQSENIQLQEAIQALLEQNTSLEEQVQTEENLGSLFGWLVKLFNR